MRLKIIFNILLISSGLLFGQSKMEAGFNFGWYLPELTGLDSSLEQSAGKSFMRENALIGYSFSLGIFPSARIGYAQSGSYFSGTSDTTEFSRKLVYRMLVLETYFRPFRKIELNFALAPMWNRGVINLDIKNTEDVWDAQVGNYTFAVRTPEKMVTNFFGFASMVGIRYYILSWLALDLKTGFMSSGYKSDNWKFSGDKVTGPVLVLDKEPIFKGSLIFSW